MEQNKEVLLKVDHLCQYFSLGRRKQNKAVHDVSFEVYKGEVFGLVGESGCGKTTTGRSIIRLYDITSGNIYFKGHRIGAGTLSYKKDIEHTIERYNKVVEPLKKQLKENYSKEIEDKIIEETKKKDAIIEENKKLIRQAKHDQKYGEKDFAKEKVKEVVKTYLPKVKEAKDFKSKLVALKTFLDEARKARRSKVVTQIQMIFQDPIGSLDPRMTVRDIIAEGLIINGEKNKEVIDKKVFDILEKVGLLKEHATRYPHEFSGGQRQRIGIARSIVMEPEMIIADEPVSALDVSIQAQVINLINDLRKELGLTVLFIAHDLSVVKYFSDRIGVMYYGDLVELATSEEIFLHPMHPYTKSLLSAIPLPDPKYEKKRKRIIYNPLKEHDYLVDKPSLREITPNHFVFCNNSEEEKLKKEFNHGKKRK